MLLALKYLFSSFLINQGNSYHLRSFVGLAAVAFRSLPAVTPAAR